MKTNLDRIFKTDADVEKTGVWFMVSDETGFLVLPFRPTNSRMKAAMATHFKPFARQIDLGTLDSEKEREIMVKIFVNACLVDWKGVEIEGKITPFSKEVAIGFLMRLPELYSTLIDYASDFKNFKEEFEEQQELGNS